MTEENTHLLQLGGGYGDLHCMKCQKICNFEQGNYCCSHTENMSHPTRRAESAFLMICLQRHAIDEMVRAMLAGKKIVDKKGHCVFCRTVKQHEEEKWCAGKTIMELYLHQVDKEENKINKHLEKYLEILLKNQDDSLKKDAASVRREARYIAEDCNMTKDELAHVLARQAREQRRTQRKEWANQEVENDAIRRRLAKKLVTKRNETMKKIERGMEAMKVSENSK